MYRKIETWYLRHTVAVEVVFIAFCVLALLVDIACMCGLWENHSGNVVALFILPEFMISSCIRLWNWQHGNGENVPWAGGAFLQNFCLRAFKIRSYRTWAFSAN